MKYYTPKLRINNRFNLTSIVMLVILTSCVRSSLANNDFGHFNYSPLNNEVDMTNYMVNDLRAAFFENTETQAKKDHFTNVWSTPNVAFFPLIEIIDPCTCRESSPGSGGNATDLNNGQFIETIQVTAPSGQAWYIAEVNGLYDVTSPQPPSSPILMTTGTTGATLVEAPAGVYSISGIHVDAIGYSITVTNGTDSLSIANICSYPNPVITSNLRGGYCISQSAVPLAGNGGGASGNGQFDLLNEDGSIVLLSNINEINPATLSPRTYQLRYTFDGTDIAPCMNCAPGCVQSIIEEVDIVTGNESLTCNDNIQISLDTNCSAVVDADMILEGTYDSYGIYDVEVLENLVSIGVNLDGSHIGLDLKAKVINTCTGNSCWTDITVEDKLKPVINCPITAMTATCTADLSVFPAPIVIDNCDGNIAPSLISESSETFDCGNADDIIKRITRIWRAVDSYNNVSPNCQQVIEIVKPNLSDIQFPANLNDIDLPALTCNTNNTTPAFTGFPTINGLPLNANDVCGFSVTFHDDVIGTCGGSSEIQRNWSVFDWCNPVQAGINPAVFVQSIKLKDTTPPSILAPNDLTISALGNNCTGETILLPATVTDACSDISVTVLTPNQFITNNGGSVNNLPIGEHIITYTATDDCGNVATDNMTLTVVDDLIPAAICDENTIVSLNNNGVGDLFATALDDGSYDTCTDVIFAVQIMNSGAPFNGFVSFGCEDVDSVRQVIFRVTDINGNENFCMVNVTIQNKIGPSIVCPIDVTVNCTDDLEDLSITGNPATAGNCGIANVSFTDISTNINSCGEGTIVRAFTVVDVSGMTNTCQHTITVVNPNPATISDIQFPADYEINNCVTADVLHPDSLPTQPVNYSRPILDAGDCTLLAVNYQDEVLTVVAPACFKIVRTWTIIDWCVYDATDPNSPGVFQNIQTIKVVDETDPILTCPADSTYLITENNCLTTVNLPAPTVDDCNPNTALIVSSSLGIGFGPFTDVAEGSYTITYTANDGCNNVVTCMTDIMVIDGKNPSPKCDGLITVVMPTNGMITVPATQLNDGSDDNCTAASDLIFSFSADVSAVTATFTCDDIGANTVQIWVTDEAQNQDFCETTVEIQDPNNACDDDNLVVFNGGITNLIDTPVGNVEIELTGFENSFFLTDDSGQFEFTDLPAGQDYEIKPYKNTGLMNGVTTTDLLAITRHIIGMKTIDSPYKMIAADINNNGAISTSDIVALRKAILLMTDAFPNNTSWRFIDASYEFPEIGNPFIEVIPESIQIQRATENQEELDFIAIKIGDLNGNANPNDLLAIDDRNNDEYQLSLQNKTVTKGEVFSTVFKKSDIGDMESMQFALEFGTELELVEIESTKYVDIHNFGQARLADGLLTFSWTVENDMVLSNPQNDFIILKWRAKSSLELADHLSINPTKIPAEIKFTEEQETMGLKLAFNDAPSIGLDIENYPNPFKEQTYVHFILPEEEEIEVRIFHLDGQLLFMDKVAANAGQNQLVLGGEELAKKGMLILEMETQWGVFYHKMLKM